MDLITISYSINQTKLKTYIKMKTILLSIALLFAVSCKKNKSIEPETPVVKTEQSYSYSIGTAYEYAHLITCNTKINGTIVYGSNVGTTIEFGNVKIGDILYLDMTFTNDGIQDSASIYLNNNLVKKEYSDTHITMSYTVN